VRPGLTRRSSTPRQAGWRQPRDRAEPPPSVKVRLVFDRLKSTGSTNAIDLGPPA
jgi:hypothetical protein